MFAFRQADWLAVDSQTSNWLHSAQLTAYRQARIIRPNGTFRLTLIIPTVHSSEEEPPSHPIGSIATVQHGI